MEDVHVSVLDDETRVQLARYRRRAARSLAVGLVVLVPAVALVLPMLDASVARTSLELALSGVPMAIALTGILAGGGALVRAARMERVLASHPWRRWSARYVDPSNPYDRKAVLLMSESGGEGGPDAGAVARLKPVLKWSMTRSGVEHARTVDVAGDAGGSGVLRVLRSDELMLVTLHADPDAGLLTD